MPVRFRCRRPRSITWSVSRPCFTSRHGSVSCGRPPTFCAPGGRLTLTDILLANPFDHAPVDVAVLEETIRREYGPWPQLWCGFDQLLESACQSGLVLERIVEATDQTLPTYRMTAPGEQTPLPPRPSAGSLMRWLHREGYLSYLCVAFTKA